MSARRVLWAAFAVLLTASPACLRAGCKVSILAELPVTMNGLQPMVKASFEGNETHLIADSGAFYSMISDAVATQFKLRRMANADLELTGVGGWVSASVAVVRNFGLAGHTLHDIQFVVGGSEMGGGAAGVMGQNILGFVDTEFDLAKGVIRLIRAQGCAKTSLAYWASDQPYSQMDIEELSTTQRHTLGAAYLNGTKIRVLFDTGASTSVLSLRASARVGVKPGDAGVVDGGEQSGIGRGSVASWIAPFESFKIGQEEIKNTHLRIGGSGIGLADMLLGADFFLSHRVYVANSQHKLYFTYNGGAVFNLTTTRAASTVSHETDKPAATTADGTAPMDASALARRGAAFASRRDYVSALADLNRACELDPKEAQYFRQRGLIFLQTAQREAALADIDHALQLRPNDANTLLMRANLRLADGKKVEALADVRAADQATAPEADLRLAIGDGYLGQDDFAAAVGQYDLWIKNHPVDHKRSEALNSRCWARALWGKELEKAEKDCSASLKLRDKASPAYAEVLDSRGLVRLRQGRVATALADYEAALMLVPKQAWSLYGRGLCKARLGGIDEGNADIAMAVALEPDVAELAKKYGVVP